MKKKQMQLDVRARVQDEEVGSQRRPKRSINEPILADCDACERYGVSCHGAQFDEQCPILSRYE